MPQDTILACRPALGKGIEGQYAGTKVPLPKMGWTVSTRGYKAIFLCNLPWITSGNYGKDVCWIPPWN